MSDPSASLFRHNSDSGDYFPDDGTESSWISCETVVQETRDISDDESSTSLSRSRSRSRSPLPSSTPRLPDPPVEETPTATNAHRPISPNPCATPTPCHYNWGPYPDVDPYESALWLGAFEKRAGITVDGSSFRPLDYFSLFFDDEVNDFFVKETNDYAVHVLSNSGDTFYRQRWKATSALEMRAFLGLQISKYAHHFTCQWVERRMKEKDRLYLFR